MATLLETVNKVIVDNGIAGGEEIDSFDSVEPEISRLINMVIDADYQIQGAWHDWPFMYATEVTTVTAGLDNILLPTRSVQSIASGAISTTTITSAYPVKDVDRGSMLCKLGTLAPIPFVGGDDDASSVLFMEWAEFERAWERQTKTAQDVPAAWTLKPDRTLVMSHLAPTGGWNVRYRYWMMPRKVPRHIDAYMYVPSGVFDVADTYYAGVSQAVVELATMKWARAERQFDMLAIAAEAYKSAMEELRSLYGNRQEAHSRMVVQSPLEIYPQ